MDSMDYDEYDIDALHEAKKYMDFEEQCNKELIKQSEMDHMLSNLTEDEIDKHYKPIEF